MIVTIRDSAALSALRPLEVVSYLRSTGWSKKHELARQWTEWVLDAPDGDSYEVVVPLSPTYRDFAVRMLDVLRTLEVAEDRPQPEILQDLLVTSADVIRIRLMDDELANGSVPLEEGAGFFAGARDMMLAAACAAVENRSYYPGRRPTQAVDYMRKARLGQTEHGSFVLTVISRVTPSLSGQNSQLFEAEEPFERRVTQTLSEALLTMRSAAETAAASGRVDSFVHGVAHGISANLCDAVVQMGTHSDGDRNLEIQFTWSRSRPVPQAECVSRNILFPADVFPLLVEASHHLKETAPRDDFEAYGPVVRLERQESSPDGKVTIHCFVDGKPRKVVVGLSEDDYHDAVNAHDQQRTVRCSGRLVREGGTHRLLNATDFRVDTES